MPRPARGSPGARQKGSALPLPGELPVAAGWAGSEACLLCWRGLGGPDRAVCACIRKRAGSDGARG